jgi:rhodanese-related sulfurtransferase
VPIPIPQVEPSDAKRRVDAGALLLDVREDDEWTAGHSSLAQHVVMSDVPASQTALDKDREIVVVCRSGGRSQKVAEFLSGQGYTVANLAGGMQAWAAAGLDVSTDSGAPGAVI